MVSSEKVSVGLSGLAGCVEFLTRDVLLSMAALGIR